MKYFDLLIKSKTNKAERDKRNNQKVAKKIDVYANKVINDRIINDKLGEPLPHGTYNGLLGINKDKIDKEYNELIKSDKTGNDLYTQVQIQRLANAKSLNITDAQFKRLNDNVKAIDNTIRAYGLNVEKYKELNSKRPLTESRRGIVTESIQNINAITSAGVNIRPHVYGYRELSPLTEGLHRQSQIQMNREKAEFENSNALINGKEAPNTHKTWIWTGAGDTTRHQSNNGKTVPINEKFEIVNDSDGRVDMMMYPLDPLISSSNGFICYCEVEYHNNPEGLTSTPSFGERIDNAMNEVNRRLESVKQLCGNAPNINESKPAT